MGKHCKVCGAIITETLTSINTVILLCQNCHTSEEVHVRHAEMKRLQLAGFDDGEINTMIALAEEMASKSNGMISFGQVIDLIVSVVAIHKVEQISAQSISQAFADEMETKGFYQFMKETYQSKTYRVWKGKNDLDT